MAIVAQAAGDRLPSYVTREQARAIINVAATTTHRLLLEVLWQSGGRKVLRLRPCDLDPGAPILHLVNLRHMMATEMLRASAPLAEIGQVLRHRSSLSTAIYAKVDHHALTQLARPWPTGGVA